LGIDFSLKGRSICVTKGDLWNMIAITKGITKWLPREQGYVAAEVSIDSEVLTLLNFDA
jgi:hypothetical protein